MSEPEIITSPQNPKIKALKKLEKAAERKAQNLILIEGLREAVLASRAGYEITQVFICPEILKEQKAYPLSELQTTNHKPQTFQINEQVYNTLAYRETTEGIIATARPKKLTLDSLGVPLNPLILIIEAVEKPGNLGAMLRSADAAGVDAVIICDAKTDLYNPNVIRSSIGTVFTNRIALSTPEKAIAYLKQKGVSVYAADPDAEKYHYQQDYTAASAFVVGAESTGLSKTWLDTADEKIKIPMGGKIDSLNVSASAAILLFEARRQRMV